MARQPMVTRTFQTTKVKILAVEVKTEQPKTVEMVLPRTYKDTTAMLKQAKKIGETDDLKLVHIIEHSVEETLYGMPEADFIRMAKPLPPRTVHEDAEDGETVTE